MGIFNGIEFLFFFLGVFATCSVWAILYFKQKYCANIQDIVPLASGLFLLLFTLAWSVSSVLENEHQAANMGLLFFGLPAILLVSMAWKKLRKQTQSAKNS